MSLIANSDLPTFARLRQEGLEVLDASRAAQQDIRELHVGIMNLMPDAALQATERQFMRMVGSCNRIAQFKIHLFSAPGIPRDVQAAAHIAQYYEPFEQIKASGLDALILTGANPAQSDITKEPFWDSMLEVVDWAQENVSSVLCSCLASHALVKQFHGIERYKLPQKRWGVYSHRITQEAHPLTANINTRFDAPHSHVYEVNAKQLKDKNLKVLAASEEADFHLATSEDGFRFVYFQGHPEYDAISLFKEYKREVGRFIEGTIETYPAFPEHTFSRQAAKILSEFRDEVLSSDSNDVSMSLFPEEQVLPHLDNTWSDTGKAVVNNWLGLVYQLTDKDRKAPFMKGIDPQNPLGLI
jgi:homoserine O-succinyltransferase